MATIIVVDDSAFMRGTLKAIVESAQHEVIGMAKEGKEALEMYTKLKPDLVLMDIVMKGMDGISTLKALREVDSQAKVIMVSALGQERKQEEARELGAFGYIRKPFEQKEIIAEIDRVVSDAKR